MIGRQGALAGVAVDHAPGHPLGDGRGGQHEVDAHAAVLVEVAGAVVPVGVQPAVVGPAPAEDVLEPPRLQGRDGLALGRRDVRRPLEGLRVPDVAVLGGDVEVAGHDHRRVRAARGGQVGAQPAEPGQLVVVVVVPDRAAVGHVDRREADATAGGGDQAGVGVRIGTVGEAVHHALEPDLGEDGDAVPLPLAVMGALVAEGGEGHRGEGGVGELGLLHAEHVGRDVVEPGLDAGHAGFQGVHVPRREAHSSTLPVEAPALSRRRARRPSCVPGWPWPGPPPARHPPRSRARVTPRAPCGTSSPS